LHNFQLKKQLTV